MFSWCEWGISPPKQALFTNNNYIIWSLCNQKEPTLSKTLFASWAQAQLSFLASKYSFWKKGKILTFTFHLLSSPLLLLFFAHFFGFVGHSLGFILGGKVFVRSWRIMKLFWRKYEWVRSGTRFSMEFSGQSYMFFSVFFSGLFHWMALIWVWFQLKGLVLPHKLVVKVIKDHWKWCRKWYKRMWFHMSTHLHFQESVG